MRRGIVRLLPICLVVLTSNGAGISQESQPVVQEKAVPAAQAKPSAAAQEEKAAAKAAAEKRRAEARALRQEKRILAQQKRVVAQQKRVEAQEQRIRAHIVAEHKHFLDRAFQQVKQAEGTFKWLGSRAGFGKVVKGAPYSATAITEHTQTLSDGNQIIQRNEAVYYRDSEGRTRMEQRLKTIGKWTTPGEPPQVTTIFDPVTGNHYSLNSRTRIALLDARGPQKPPNSTPKPNPEPKPKQPGNAVSEKSERDQHVGTKDSSDRKRKESLGSRVIEGVSAEGTRQTVTIPAGEIGNVAPIEITDESWYSSELQMPVMTRHHDPRSGDTIYKLTNINRSEPARSLFEVPADYQIVDRKATRAPRTPELPRTTELPKLPKLTTAPEPPKTPEDEL